jgi:hypothetical protein
VWSRGETQLLEELITDDFAYKDTVWARQRPVVGAASFKGFVVAMRTAYPDLMYEIQQVGAWGGGKGGVAGSGQLQQVIEQVGRKGSC